MLTSYFLIRGFWAPASVSCNSFPSRRPVGLGRCFPNTWEERTLVLELPHDHSFRATCWPPVFFVSGITSTLSAPHSPWHSRPFAFGSVRVFPGSSRRWPPGPKHLAQHDRVRLWKSRTNQRACMGKRSFGGI